jgi:hypothetical protein
MRSNPHCLGASRATSALSFIERKGKHDPVAWGIVRVLENARPLNPACVITINPDEYHRFLTFHARES